MRGIIISIGNELLNGRTVNGNATEIARFLFFIGTRTIRVETVPDLSSSIITALKGAMKDAEVIIMTGGLGPTHDDMTKGVLAEFFEVPLIFDEAVLRKVAERYEKRALSMPEIVRNQALRPANALPLENQWGTAPGLYIQAENRHIYALPGVPREMRGLMKAHIIPRLRSLGGAAVGQVLNFRTTGISEPLLFETLQPFLKGYPDLETAFLPSLEGVDFRLTLRGENPEILSAEVMKTIGAHVYSREPEGEIAAVLGEMLLARGATLAVAESCSGGLIQDRLTDIPGSSAYFLGGVVAYSNAVKTAELGVAPDLLAKHGAVSEPVARQMAEGVRKRFGSDWGMATTGVAGPGGGSPEKPVGLVFIAVAGPEKNQAQAFRFGDERRPNKVRSAQAAMWMAVRELRQTIVKRA